MVEKLVAKMAVEKVGCWGKSVAVLMDKKKVAVMVAM